MEALQYHDAEWRRGEGGEGDGGVVGCIGVEGTSVAGNSEAEETLLLFTCNIAF